MSLAVTGKPVLTIFFFFFFLGFFWVFLGFFNITCHYLALRIGNSQANTLDGFGPRTPSGGARCSPRVCPVPSGWTGLVVAVCLASPRTPGPARRPGTRRVPAGQPGALGAGGKGGLGCLSLPASPEDEEEEDFLRTPHL